MLDVLSIRGRALSLFSVLFVMLAVGPIGIVRSSLAQDATPVATPGPQSPWWQDAVCYEIFVRSFIDSDGDGIGDLAGLTNHLDYLNDGDPATKADLGVNCIWLMPVSEATSYHGYDTVDFLTIEEDYGTNDDFRALVAAAAERGIRIITDLVLNHVSIEHPWFVDALVSIDSPYRDFFVFVPTDPGYKGAFGQQVWFPTPDGSAHYYATFGEGLPDLNYRNPAVTTEAEAIARFWLKEMGVSGFRLDAIKHLIEDGAKQENTDETHAWLRDFSVKLSSIRADAYTVGEIFGASAFILSDYYPDQLTAYFQFDLGTQILQATQVRTAGSFSFSLEDSVERLPEQRFAPFLTNHDQTRSMTLLGGDVDRAKLAATALLTLPGLPFIYYGEEIGMTGEKPDPRLRTPMQWTADGTGFSSGTPWEPVQDDSATINVAAQDADPNSLLNHYRTLIDLHTAHPALAHGTCVVLDTPSPVAAYVRQSDEQALLVVLNFDDEPVSAPELAIETTGLAPGTYDLLPVFGSTAATSITVGAGGEIVAYTGIAELAPTTGYVFQLIAFPS